MAGFLLNFSFWLFLLSLGLAMGGQGFTEPICSGFGEGAKHQ
jgi:hypothetical protein